MDRRSEITSNPSFKALGDAESLGFVSRYDKFSIGLCTWAQSFTFMAASLITEILPCYCFGSIALHHECREFRRIPTSLSR